MNLLDGLPRQADQDGHLIPVTGQWCQVCRYPLHPVLDTEVHPLCNQETPR